MGEPRNTFFSEHLDALACEQGGWPQNVVVYALEMVNDNQCLLKGGELTGRHRRDGRPIIENKREYRAFCTIDQYRGTFAKADAS